GKPSSSVKIRIPLSTIFSGKMVIALPARTAIAVERVEVVDRMMRYSRCIVFNASVSNCRQLQLARFIANGKTACSCGEFSADVTQTKRLELRISVRF